MSLLSRVLTPCQTQYNLSVCLRLATENTAFYLTQSSNQVRNYMTLKNQVLNNNHNHHSTVQQSIVHSSLRPITTTHPLFSSYSSPKTSTLVGKNLTSGKSHFFSTLFQTHYSAYSTSYSNSNNSKPSGGAPRVFSGKSPAIPPLVNSQRKRMKETLHSHSQTQKTNASSTTSVIVHQSAVPKVLNTAYACCTAESYNLDSLVVLLHNQEFNLSAFPMDDDVDNRKVLHVYFKNGENSPKTAEMFIFKEGTFVTWGATTEQLDAVRVLLKQVEINPYSSDLEDYEYEAVPYEYGESTAVEGGIFTLQVDADPHTQKLEKYVISDAMALSVKLGTWESLLDQYVIDIEHIPKALMEGKKPPISSQETWKNTGALLYLRYNINLFGDLLSPPDFYWDRPNYESLYKKILRLLDVSARTQVINSKLNHWEQLAGILRDHVRDSASTRLELIIIYLIALEVFFQLLKYLIKLYDSMFGEQEKGKEKESVVVA